MIKQLYKRMLGRGHGTQLLDASIVELKSRLDALVIQAASSDLPPPADPKVKAGQQSIPSYLKTAKPSTTTPLPAEDRLLANKDLTSLRTSQGTRNVVRDFAAASPDLSATIYANLRLAITNTYLATANNRDGTLNPEATRLLQQLIVNMDVLSRYDEGFAGINSLRSNSEMLGREMMLNGAMAAELVLDKTRLPERIQPLSVVGIEFLPDKTGRRLIPRQKVGGDIIDLDIPTFFYVALDQDVRNAYAASPLESAVQPTIFGLDFQNDVRKIVKRAVHPRMVVSLDEEKFRKSIPAEIQGKPDKLAAYMDQIVSDVEQAVNNLNPEDAVVLYNSITLSVLDHGNTNLSKEYEVIQSMADSKLSTGAKILPSILGHGNGTANTASAEVLMFMKNVEGAIWSKLNEMYSRILTLAVRLYGYDVFVNFVYAPIDLRPTNELEAFLAMKQSRILEQLSYGFITDEGASLLLTGHLPPPGAPKLSGTMFLMNKSVGTNNPNNGTTTQTTNDGSAMNQSLKPNTPTAPKGGQKTKAETTELRAV